MPCRTVWCWVWPFSSDRLNTVQWGTHRELFGAWPASLPPLTGQGENTYFENVLERWLRLLGSGLRLSAVVKRSNACMLKHTCGHTCVHVLFTRSLAGGHGCDLCVADGETGAQRGKVNCCQSHSFLRGAAWPQTKPSGYRDCVPSATQCCMPRWRLLGTRHPMVASARPTAQCG